MQIDIRLYLSDCLPQMPRIFYDHLECKLLSNPFNENKYFYRRPENEGVIDKQNDSLFMKLSFSCWDCCICRKCNMLCGCLLSQSSSLHSTIPGFRLKIDISNLPTWRIEVTWLAEFCLTKNSEGSYLHD